MSAPGPASAGLQPGPAQALPQVPQVVTSAGAALVPVPASGRPHLLRACVECHRAQGVCREPQEKVREWGEGEKGEI